MRKLFLTCTAVVFIGLAGCTTMQITTAIGQIQAYTAVACKFIPTVATILAFLNAGIGSAVGTIGGAICASVPPPASAQFRALPHYGAGGPPVVAGQAGNIPVVGWRTQ